VSLQREITVIVKVTNACNMACRYCFIEPAIFHKSMTPETMRRVVRAFLDSAWFASVRFVWHGGEPLLRGRRFFEGVLDEQKARPSSVAFSNALQTNATLLDDAMLAFLVGNGFEIGLSMDGPKAINDPVRIARGSIPIAAHDVTVDAAARLRVAGSRPGAIVVVNGANVDHPESVYREFKRRGIDLKVNPLARSGLAAVDGAGLDIDAGQYGSFLTRLFDAWFDDPDPTIQVEPLSHHIARILGIPGVVHGCHFTKSCHRSFLGIAPDGDLFPCGMFQGEPAFRYGNVHALSPDEVATTALFGTLEEREARVLEGCSKCAFVDLCYGGCMFHSLKNGGRFEEKDYYCAGYKMYFEHALRRIHADLRRASERAAGPAGGQ
jgi:uncharacterized protein